MTYEEYLRQNGATAEDLVLLDRPNLRKAFEKQQVELETVRASEAQARADREATEQWYRETANPQFIAKQNEVIAARAEAARYREALKTAKAQGLIEMDVEDGGGTPPPNTPPNSGVPGIDPAKYVTLDHLAQVADREGDAIAIAQDIAWQHQQLFPDKPLNFRELRREAVSKRVSVEQLWKDKYQVDAAITSRAQKAEQAKLDAAREEGRKEIRQQLAAGHNPDLQTPMPSSSPFTVRKTAGDIRAKQPWEAPSEGVLSDDRVRRVATKIMTQ